MIYSAFCGTGKTHLVNNNKNYIEVECWEYDHTSDFPYNYIKSIISHIDKYQHIFISTNPIVLNELSKLDIGFTLIYPNVGLFLEYRQRYIDRGSSDEFISMITYNWDKWLRELIKCGYRRYIILESGEYLSKYLK